MITKGQIKQKIGNKYAVRIPLFESAGNPQEVILTATLCYDPGNLEAYKEGDIVFVGFENNQISSPVILGKLYTGIETETNTYSYNSTLKTEVSAILPKKTSIGEFTPEQVYAALKSNQIYEERIKTLENEVRGLIKLVTNNISDIEKLQEEWEEIFGAGTSTRQDIDAIYKGEPVTDILEGDNITTIQDIDDIYEGQQVTDPIVSDLVTNNEDIDELYTED